MLITPVCMRFWGHVGATDSLSFLNALNILFSNCDRTVSFPSAKTEQKREGSGGLGAGTGASRPAPRYGASGYSPTNFVEDPDSRQAWLRVLALPLHHNALVERHLLGG